MKCPCINCICIPTCKHKNYFDLVVCCQTVHDYIFADAALLGNKYFHKNLDEVLAAFGRKPKKENYDGIKNS